MHVASFGTVVVFRQPFLWRFCFFVELRSQWMQQIRRRIRSVNVVLVSQNDVFDLFSAVYLARAISVSL